MPQPVAPPPSNEAGAITNPRQLQRWLDCNPVPVLTRTKSYITLPAFSVATQWKGYSEIVAIFNYGAANNFSLKAFTAPTNPNYVACVMWVDSQYNVHRYRLWEGVGELFFAEIPLYTKQKIGKNFRIEIWNVEPPFDALASFTLAGCDTAAVNSLYVYNSGTGLWNGSTYNAVLTIGHQWSVVFGLNQILSPGIVTPVGNWTFNVGTGTAPFATIATTVSQATDITLYTSKLGVYDYRYANDTLLIANSAIVTDLTVALPANLPISWPAGSYPTLNS